MLVPSGFLFTSGSYEQLRRFLLERTGLHTVVDLPSGVLQSTSIGCAILSIRPGVRSAELKIVSTDDESLLTSGRHGKRQLTGWQALAELIESDGDHELLARVSYDQLAINNWVMQFARYKQFDNGVESLFGSMSTVALSGVAEIYRPLVIKKDAGSDGTTYNEVLISDFGPNGLILGGSRERTAPASIASRQKLKPGDILLAVKGTIGKAAIVDQRAAKNLLASATTVIIRLRLGRSPNQPTYTATWRNPS